VGPIDIVKNRCRCFSPYIVESRKVVPIHLPASLTKLCRSSCEHTQALARLPTKMGGLIDTSARLAGRQARPLTPLKFRLGLVGEWSFLYLQVDRSRLWCWEHSGCCRNMPMNHPDVVSQCLSLSFELKGAAAFILTWMQAFLLLSNEPGAGCFIGTLNATPVVNYPEEI